jgi:hypothetical protein
MTDNKMNNQLYDAVAPLEVSLDEYEVVVPRNEKLPIHLDFKFLNSVLFTVYGYNLLLEYYKNFPIQEMVPCDFRPKWPINKRFSLPDRIWKISEAQSYELFLPLSIAELVKESLESQEILEEFHSDDVVSVELKEDNKNENKPQSKKRDPVIVFRRRYDECDGRKFGRAVYKDRVRYYSPHDVIIERGPWTPAWECSYQRARHYVKFYGGHLKYFVPHDYAWYLVIRQLKLVVDLAEKGVGMKLRSPNCMYLHKHEGELCPRGFALNRLVEFDKDFQVDFSTKFQINGSFYPVKKGLAHMSPFSEPNLELIVGLFVVPFVALGCFFYWLRDSLPVLKNAFVENVLPYLASTFDTMCNFDHWLTYHVLWFFSSRPFSDVASLVGPYYQDFADLIMCGRTVRKKNLTFSEARDSFFVVDGNHRVNCMRLNFFYTKEDELKLELHGKTIIGDMNFPFPVFCDVKTMLNFVRLFEEVPSYDRRQLLCHGEFTFLTKKLARPLFEPVLRHRLFQMALSNVTNPHLIGMVQGLTFYYLGYSALFISLFSHLIVMLRIDGKIAARSFLYVLGEEIYKSYFGVWSIALFEVATRFHYCPIIQIFPFTMHLAISFLPFPVAVIVHLLYNNRIEGCFSEHASGAVTTADTRKAIELASYVLDVLLKIKKGDKVGLMLSLGMKYGSVEDFFISMTGQQVENVSLDNLRDYIWSSTELSNLEVTMLNGEDTPKEDYSFLFYWLPTNVKSSKTFSRIVALAMLITSTKIFRDSSVLPFLGSNMTREDFIEKGSIITTIGSAITSVFSAMQRVVEKKDFNAFWDIPPDVDFIIQATELLAYKHAPESIEEIQCSVAKANTLVAQRAYMRNSSHILGLIRSLETMVKVKFEFLRQNKPRVPPLAIWLNGIPGTGKTTKMEELVNMLSRRPTGGWVRFPGDVIQVNVHDKYPVSTGCNTLAKVLFLNDVPENYTEFPKMDLLPLDIMLQMIFDVYPMAFRAAAVEDKGKVLNDIQYVFLTSNHCSFVFPGETLKLYRRIEPGVIVDMAVYNKNRPVSYEVFSSFDQVERNESSRYIIQNLTCKEKHMTFTNSQISLDETQFATYVITRVERWEKICADTADKFKNNAHQCDCGFSTALHYCRGDANFVRFVINPLIPKYYKCFFPSCEKFIVENHATFDVVAYLPCPPEHVSGKTSVLASVVACCSFASFLVIFFAMFPGLKDACYEGLILKSLHLLRDKVDEAYFTSPYIKKMLMSFDGVHWMKTQYAYRAKNVYWEIVKAFRKWHKYILALGAGCFLLSKYFENHPEMLSAPIYVNEVDPKSMNVANMRREVNFPVEKRREWGKVESEIHVVDLVTKGVGTPDLLKLCQSNLLNVKFHLLTAVSPVTLDALVFVISPEWCIFNKHYVFESEGVPKSTTFSITFNDVTVVHEISDLRYDNSNELVLMKHSFPILATSLHKFLPQKNINFCVKVQELGTVDEVVATPCSFKWKGRVYPALNYPGVPVKQKCSTPVVAKVNGGSFLVGLVSAGIDASLCCSPISREWLDVMMQRDSFPFVEEAVVMLNGFESPGPLSINSDLRNVSSPYLNYVGTMVGPNNSFHSTLRKTRFYSEIEGKFKVPYGIPKKLKNVVDGVYYSALTQTCKNVNLSCNVVTSEMNEVVRHYVNSAFPIQFLKDKKIKLSPISLSEAIFGCPELGIDRINFKTSCGPHLKTVGIKNKYDMFSVIDDTETGVTTYLYELKEDVTNKIADIDAFVSKNVCFVPEVDMVAKDEVRPQEKLDVAKVRLFSVLCAAYNLYGRMLLMPIIQYLMQYPNLSECCGTMNAGSHEWNDLGQTMNSGPEWKVIDMDFSSFDWSHWARLFEMVAMAFKFGALRLGYTVEEANKCYIFIISFKWQLARFMMDIFLKYKGMPSGVIMTLIMNSIINSFLMRIAYLRLVGPLDTFLEKVKTRNVGDDNFSAILDTIIDKYNMVTIAKVFFDLGYIATPAKKGNVIQRYIRFEDITFLKRTFLWSDDLGGYVAPIDTDSIYKALAFESMQSGISPEQRLIDVMGGAQREAFLHGKKFFIEFQQWALALFANHRMNFSVLIYEELVTEYKEKRFRTFML